MIPVPSYQLIPFLAWLHERGLRLTREPSDFGRLEEAAYEFIRLGGLQRSGPLPLGGDLRSLLLVFQSCNKIREPTLEEQMRHFSTCGQCIGLGAVPRISENLHPLLLGFLRWSESEAPELEDRLARSLRKIGARPDSSPQPSQFGVTIQEVGGHLYDEFLRFLEVAEPRLVRGYESWRSDRSNVARRERESWQVDHEPDTEPISPRDSHDFAAVRLARSAWLAIEGGFYDQLEQTPQLMRLMALVGETPQDLAQVLSFLAWLKKRDPELNLPGNIPSEELENLTSQFCEELGYTNGRSFARDVKRWLAGAGPRRFIDRIARFLRLRENTRENPLDRYNNVKFHGMFLFLSSGDFPGFIEAHWRDLHHLTGDDLDIYYSHKDLSDRASGYEIASEIRNLNLKVDALPAFLLWENELESATAIPLKDLEHSEILEVLARVVQAIRNDKGLRPVSECGESKADEIRGKKGKALLVESGATLIINKGGVMGDTNINKGVAGAVGSNNVVTDNVLIQEARSAVAEAGLSPVDAALITSLAEHLAAQQIETLTLKERLEGAQHLAALASATESSEPQEQPVAGWRQWLGTLGERKQVVLSTLAHLTTIAVPVAKLLGLPV